VQVIFCFLVLDYRCCPITPLANFVNTRSPIFLHQLLLVQDRRSCPITDDDDDELTILHIPNQPGDLFTISHAHMFGRSNDVVIDVAMTDGVFFVFCVFDNAIAKYEYAI